MAVELFPALQWFDNSGKPLAGGLISTFAAGTTTPLATFTDSTGGTPNSNPVVLDSAGRAQMWFSPAAYKLVIKTSAGVTLMTVDNITLDNLAATISSLLSTGNITIQQSTAATNIANQSSPNLQLQANYWNGSASATDQWQIQDVVSTGTNPTSTLTFSHSGSSGTSAVSISGTTMLSTTLTKSLEGRLYIDSTNTQGWAGSDPGAWINSALAALPAGGGIIELANGSYTCNTGIVITKPVIICGQGQGGAIDGGMDNSYIAGTTLLNNMAGTNLITISLPASNSLWGVILRDFAIIGNKNIGGATAGDNIAFISGGPATAIRDVEIKNVLSVFAKGNGLTLQDNVFLVRMIGCQFDRNAGNGLSITSTGLLGTPSQIRAYCCLFDRNTGDGVNITTIGPRDFEAFGCTFADSGVNGINVVAGASNAHLNIFGCDFETNGSSHLLIKDGFAHYIGGSQFFATGVTLFGINVDPPVGANFSQVQVTLISNNFGANLTKDVQFSANTHLAVMFPQASNNFTYLDSSGAVVRLDINSSGAMVFTGIGGFAPSTNGSASLGTASLNWNNLYLFGKSLIYNNVLTAGNGLASVHGATSQKAESAADANVLTFTPPAVAGSYRIRFNLAASAAAAAVVGWTATWKDSNGNAKAPTNLALFQVGTAAPALTFTTSTTDNFYGEAQIDVDASATAIVVKFTLGSGTITAKASATIERVI